MAIMEPMVTSAAAGQTIHPSFSPGPNASDGATVGAPNGTPVGGVLAEVLVAQAAQAASDAIAANAAAFAANTAISVITSDGFLSRDEKPEIRKQRDAINGERPAIRARALEYGVSVVAYDAAFVSLITYLGTLDLSGATDTPIIRTDFNGAFTDYYNTRQVVLDGIAEAAQALTSAAHAAAAQAQSDATAANASAFAANLAISNITSDNILSRDEKPEIRKQRQAIEGPTGEYQIIADRGVFFGVDITAFVARFADLISYLNTLDLDSATDTAIDRSTFNTRFVDYFNARQAVLDGIAAAASNNRITIGGGIISGIGTANIFVDNTRAALQGLASARPASGQFIGQQYHATDTREIVQWDGFNWRSSADITALAQRSIVPQFPIIETRQGEAGHTGNRIVTHTAKRGTATIGGGTWSIVAQSLGAGSASVNSGTGAVTLSGVVQSGSYTIRYTHTDTVPTDLIVNVTYIPSTASNPAFTSGAIANFANSSFVPVTSSLSVVLPGGATSVTLTAASVDLQLFPEAPSPASVAIEMKWQRETSPGTWSDVGAAATSSPGPSVSSPEGFIEVSPGAITCNRTATGLSAGSTQNFRLVARISAGAVRTVIASGTASASA